MKKKIIKLLITIIIVAWIVSGFDDSFILSFDLIKSPENFLLALLVPLIVIPVIVNNRWKVFLKVKGIEESFLTLVKINFTAIFLGILLPSSTGYDAIRMYMIEKRHRGKRGVGSAVVFVERLLGFYILSFLGVVGAIWIVYKGGDFYLLLAIGALNMMLLSIFILINNRFLFRMVIRIMYQIKKMRKLRTFLYGVFTAMHKFPLKRTLPLTIPLIILFQLSTIVAAHFIFKAFGVDVPFYYHLAYMPVIQIISIIPLSFSGFGFREGAFVYFYGLLGVASGLAFTVSILYYSILTLVPAFLGMCIYLIKPVDLQDLKQEINKKQQTNSPNT